MHTRPRAPEHHCLLLPRGLHPCQLILKVLGAAALSAPLQKDSFYNFLWSNSVTRTRFLIATIRKQDVCQCGCKGQCSFNRIARAIVWSINLMAEGFSPSRDHEGNDFASAWRRDQVGKPLAGGYVAALTEYRADILEFTGQLGFTNTEL